MQANNISVNLKRLRVARGLSQDFLSKSAGISRPAYISIEKGKAEPRVVNLQKLADALEVKVFDIVRPVPELRGVRFRARSWGTKKAKEMREQVLCDVSLWMRDYRELEKMLGAKGTAKFDFQMRRGNKEQAFAKKMAEKAREKFKLEEEEVINDICGLIESAGIKLRFMEIDLENLFGLSIKDENLGTAIVVNSRSTISTERKIFTMVHELGHIIMHPDSFDNEKDEIDKQEKEADAFAGYFLMPEKAFHKKLNEARGRHWIEIVLHLKRIFKVSYEAVIYRLISENLAKKEIWGRFRAQCGEKYNLDFRGHKEPFPLKEIDCIEDRLSGLVREAYEKELISMSRGAEILGITVKTMRELVASWVTVQ